MGAGPARENGNFVAASNRWSAAMAPAERLEQVPSSPWTKNSTIIAVVELSQFEAGWLAGVLPGIGASAMQEAGSRAQNSCLPCMHRWRDEAVQGRPHCHAGLRLPSRPAATASGWARWLEGAWGRGARDPSLEVWAVSRETSTGKEPIGWTLNCLKRGVPGGGWRGETGAIAAWRRVPTIAEEDAKRPKPGEARMPGGGNAHAL